MTRIFCTHISMQTLLWENFNWLTHLFPTQSNRKGNEKEWSGSGRSKVRKKHASDERSTKALKHLTVLNHPKSKRGVSMVCKWTVVHMKFKMKAGDYWTYAVPPHGIDTLSSNWNMRVNPAAQYPKTFSLYKVKFLQE